MPRSYGELFGGTNWVGDYAAAVLGGWTWENIRKCHAVKQDVASELDGDLLLLLLLLLKKPGG